MTRQLYLEVFSWPHLFSLGILFILSYVIAEVIILKLGLRILRANSLLKHILAGAGLLASLNLFIRPFIPNEIFSFFVLTIVPMILLLKFYSKSKWIVCIWVSFVIMVTTALGPLLVVSRLASSDPTLASFIFENPYGVLLGSLTEAAIPGILLLMLTLFNLQIIPSPSQSLSKVDFYDIYFYCGLFWWNYRSVIRLWSGVKNNPKLDTIQLFIEWAVSGSMVVMYYLKKIQDQKKHKKFEEEQTKLTQKIEELNNTLNAAQPNSGTVPKAFLLLDPREREVLKLVGLGRPVKAIAAQLFMDRKTVSNYISRISDKLELQKDHLPVYAFAIGLVSKEECNIKDELNIKAK